MGISKHFPRVCLRRQDCLADPDMIGQSAEAFPQSYGPGGSGDREYVCRACQDRARWSARPTGSTEDRRRAAAAEAL